MSPKRGNLIVVSAPSGSGKTTLVQKLLDRVENVRFSVSFTTRARRGQEVDGVDYHFVSEKEFRHRIEKNELLEWAEVHQKLYGTSKTETEKMLAAGADVLLDVDVQGAAQVRAKKPGAVSVFILPPSFAVLESRLRGREQDSEEEIEARLEEARREIRRYDEYDYVIVNDDVEQSALVLQSIVRGERARPRLHAERIERILESFD